MGCPEIFQDTPFTIVEKISSAILNLPLSALLKLNTPTKEEALKLMLSTSSFICICM